MSKDNTIKIVREELKKVNTIIERKIIREESYQDESKLHYKLLKQYRDLTGDNSYAI